MIGVATWFSFCGLCNVVGQLRQGLGGANPDATSDSNPFEDAVSDFSAALCHVTLDAGQVNERLVNRIHLLAVSQPCGQTHHPVAHVAIQGKIGRQRHQSV